jgi:exosortase sorting signal-containing protein
MKLMLLGIADLSVAAVAGAQPSNTIGPGPVTTSHLPVVDDDGTPGPSAGDTPIVMNIVVGTQVELHAGTPAGELIVGGSNQQGGSGPVQTFTILNHPYETQSLTFTQFDGPGNPTAASVTITKPDVPAKKRGLMVTGVGTAQLHPLNADGFHDGLSGEKTGGGFSFDINFVYARSANSPTSAPDYIGLPWAQVQTLALQVKGGKSGGLANGIWVPLTVTPNTTNPSSITADLGVPLFNSPPLAAPGPPPSAFRANVPTLSGWALVVLSLALALAGWKQLGRGGASFGI